MIRAPITCLLTEARSYGLLRPLVGDGLVMALVFGVLAFVWVATPGVATPSAIAPSGRTVATRHSPSQLRRLGPDGRVSTIATQPQPETDK